MNLPTAFWESRPETEVIAQLQEAHRHDKHSSSEGDYPADLHIPNSDDDATGDSEETEDDGTPSTSVALSNPFALLAND